MAREEEARKRSRTMPPPSAEAQRQAQQQAVAEAEPGDTVLLAPAAASLDQYDNFEQRGDDFIGEVHRYLAAK